MTYINELYTPNLEKKEPVNADTLRNRSLAERLHREKQIRRVSVTLGSILQRTGSALYRAGKTLRTEKEMNSYG